MNQTTDVWATPVHWKLRVAGLEEVVPTGQLTAPPTGRNVLLSTTGDVGGFDHQSLTEPPAKGMASYFSTATGINTSGVDVQFSDPNFIVRVGSDGWNGPAKGGYSTNGGVTYNNFPTFPGSGGARGRVAVSATSRNFVWVPMGGPSYMSNNLGATWTACSGLPNNVLRSGSIYEIYAGQLPIAADRVSGNLFYVYAQGVIYVSQDTGRTFTARATGLPNDGGYASYAHLEATPGKSGDVWFSHPAGLYHSVDSGKSFVHVNPSVIVSPKWMSVGRTDTSAAGHSVVYVTNQGTAINGAYYGVFRSDDNGANWTEISSRVPTVVSNMAADQFGRVFIGLNGNGIFVGEPVSGPVTGVGITPPADTLVETDSVKLNVTLVPLYPANRAYTLSSTNPSVATVDANGWVRALTAGTASIVVTTQDGGFTDTTAITVTPFIHLSSVALDTAIWMGIGNTVSLVPKILPLDATNKKLVWTTSDSTKVRVSSGGSVTALGFGTATVTATAVDGGATATITVKVNTIAAAINLGDTVQIGNFKRDPYTQSWLGTIRTTNAINLTGVTNPAPEGVYKTSRVGLDAINIGGLVPGGRYTMRLHFAELGATVGSGGRRFDIIVGTDTTKLYDIFNAAGGRYKAVVREYVVNASSAGGVGVKLRAYTNSTAINGIELVLRPVDSVSLPVTNAFVGINDTLRITPTVWPVEASNKGVTWVSSNTSVATVSTNGLITGTGVGTAVISIITDETGKRDSVLITADSILVDSVRLQQSADTVGVRNTRQLKATVYPANASDRFISWSSSDTGIVKVNAAGLLSGIAPGNVTVTVTTREGGKTASTSVLSVVVPVTQVNLTRSTLTIGAFDTTTIGATSLPSNASNLAVSWTSSDTTVATVSANGRITAIAAGNANITATAQDGQGANKVLPVTVIPVQNCGAISNGGFESGYYNWTGAGYTTSRISEVPADVHGGLRALILSGDGTAHNHIGPVNVPGGVPITVSFWAKTGGSTVPYWAGAGFDYIDSLGNKLGSASVVIHPGGTTPHVANYKQFFINGNAPAGTARLGLWVSKAGPVTSSIYLDDFCVTVNVSSVTTDAASATIAIGASRQLSAAVLPASATHPAVTWTSSNSGIAVVDSTGLVTGVAQGTANIIAASADGLKKDTVLVEVLHQLVNVNSGDTTEGAFHKDHSYTSGSATTTYTGVSTVGVANAAPTYVYVQRRYGDTFYYDFTGFTPGQRYVVRMHFVEPFYAQAGKRVFSVKANGADVLTSLDVFAEAGQNKALVKDVSAVADSIGNLRLLFTKDIDNAAVAGIEVLGSITDYEQVIAVNSADVAIDGFSADSAYTGGSASAATAISTINYNGTANAGPLALYGKRRYGNFTYNFTGLAGNGSYVLRLHFIEPWATTTGQRVMDVKVNDELKLDNLDLIAAGKNKRLRPILRDIAVMADTAGNLNVQFISVTDNAAVAGVELLQVPVLMAEACVPVMHKVTHRYSLK
ncbi:Ig-like domain-containing protein [Chitinophaga sedimenti]|uniref:Ig-like domain-containing protein n=1 Tax=Chitinophaga sedimenti TaxID=2033606 RepID=UPI002002D14E|nr:Ig-like domain-containing protein [Chitinophaga sedimenti]MCK7554874.1 Ig-like domain-containing protein [Chitinophaga sedimenti]